MRFLVVVIALLPCATQAQELTYGWEASSSTEIFFDNSELLNNIRSGSLGGLLSDSYVRVDGAATVSAEVIAVGKGYTFGAAFEATATGSVTKDDLTSFSASSISVKSGYKDRFQLVGEVQLPAGSVNLNFRLDGIGHTQLDQSQEISTSVISVDVEDRDTGLPQGYFEYRQDWNKFNQTLTTSGQPEVSFLATFNKVLGADRAGSFRLHLRVDGLISGGTMEAGFDHTVRLESITFPDGSTPESHGLAIVFDSGLLSPNRVTGQQISDFNVDGFIDGEDLQKWQSRFGHVALGAYSTGDADGDGDADGSDFLIWQRQTRPVDSQAHAFVSVPEPSSLVLGSVAVAIVAWPQKEKNLLCKSL